MVNIIRTRGSSMGGSSTSPRSAEVGEIDTKAPFQSVKAAVSLFGEASSSSPKSKSKPHVTKKPKPQAQAVLDKEAQFHLALNKLNKLKEQVRGAESKKNETFSELDKAQRTMHELQEKLKKVTESKQSILENSEILKERAKKLEEAIYSSDIGKANKSVVDFVKQDMEITRKEYKDSILALDAAKQQLNNMCRDYEATLEAKSTAFRISQEADAAVDVHRQRVSNLTKQIATIKEALAKIKSSSKNAQEEQHKLLAQKHEELSSRRLAKKELENKIFALKNESSNYLLIYDDMQEKLVETNDEIQILEEKLSRTRAAYLESQKVTAYELEVAQKSLEQVRKEKTSIQALVESLKEELERVGKEQSEQKLKQKEADALVKKLQAELDDKKNVLEAGLVNKSTAADVSDDMAISIEQLTLETEKAKQEAEQIKKKIGEQRQLTKTTQEMIADMEVKLAILLKEVEEAKAAERSAQDEIKALSKNLNKSVDDECNGKIKLSNEEYNSLMEKIDESEKLADIKVTANFAQVEALVASQKEAAKSYEAISKEIEELKMREEEVLKIAEMAEAAKTALEVELHRMYQQEQINQTTQLEFTVESN